MSGRAQLLYCLPFFLCRIQYVRPSSQPLGCIMWLLCSCVGMTLLRAGFQEWHIIIRKRVTMIYRVLRTIQGTAWKDRLGCPILAEDRLQ